MEKDDEMKKEMAYQEDAPEQPAPEDDDGAEEKTNFDEDAAPPEDGMAAKMDQLLAGQAKILEYIEKLFEEEEGEEATEPGAEPAPSNSVALQESQKLVSFQREIDSMRREMMQLRAQKESSANQKRLRAICTENPTLDHNVLSQKLKKFSSDADKKAFLDFVESQNFRERRHPAGAAAKSFSGKSGADYLKKFQAEPARIQAVIDRAKRDYRDTIRQADEDAVIAFQKDWPDEEKYVTAAVEGEKAKPGYYEKLLFG